MSARLARPTQRSERPGSGGATRPRVPQAFVGFHREARVLCSERLREALDPRTSLFDRQLRDRRWGPTRGTEDVTSTAICLIGIHRAGLPPDHVGLSPQRTLDAMTDRARARGYLGGHGLVLWAHAVWDRAPAHRLASRLGVSPLDPRVWSARITTMEAAWLVSGLAHEALRSGARVRDALALAVRELMSRFHEGTRLFRHANAGAPLAHRLRRFVANFADQIYSVQALSYAAMVLGDAEALRTADACAARLAELQGPLGQWAWHYDPVRGVVSRFFPVYSVHQHGMAPMALMAVTAAGGAARDDALERSVAWITRNEAGVSMLDEKAGTIWRDVSPRESGAARRLHALREVLGLATREPDRPGSLVVNHETRPYEWAWCLYAGAIAAGVPSRGHPV